MPIQNLKSKIQNREAGCKNKEHPGIPWRPSAFLAHLLRLEGLEAAGARFDFRVLNAAEWLGREALREARAETQTKEENKQ